MCTGQSYDASSVGQNSVSQTVDSGTQSANLTVSLSLPLISGSNGTLPTARLVYWAIDNYLDSLIRNQAEMLRARAYQDARSIGNEIDQLAQVQNQIEASVRGLVTSHPLEFVEWSNWIPVADEL